MIQNTFDSPDNDVVTLQCSYTWPAGWSLTVCTRPSGRTGPSAWRSERFDGMTTGELYDAIEASAWCALHPRSSSSRPTP